jgi:cytochrome b
MDATDKATSTAMHTDMVPVWDPLVRVFHWSLAAIVLIDWLTDEPRWMHVWLGYLAVALVVTRVIWGFIGPTHARLRTSSRARARRSTTFSGSCGSRRGVISVTARPAPPWSLPC